MEQHVRKRAPTTVTMHRATATTMTVAMNLETSAEGSQPRSAAARLRPLPSLASNHRIYLVSLRELSSCAHLLRVNIYVQHNFRGHLKYARSRSAIPLLDWKTEWRLCILAKNIHASKPCPNPCRSPRILAAAFSSVPTSWHAGQ